MHENMSILLRVPTVSDSFLGLYIWATLCCLVLYYIYTIHFIKTVVMLLFYKPMITCA